MKLDLRTLAVFRMTVGAWALMASAHILSAPWSELVRLPTFVLMGFSSLALIAGLQTRSAALLCGISLLILGGDVSLPPLLFTAIYLPLGARFSWDRMIQRHPMNSGFNAFRSWAGLAPLFAAVAWGPHPWAAFALGLLALSPWPWARKELTPWTARIYFDGECGVCSRIVRILMNGLEIPESKVAETQTVPEIQALMVAKNSWVVEESPGRLHFGFEGLSWVLRQRPWSRPWGLLFRQPGIRWIGERAYQAFADHRPSAGRLVPELKPRAPLPGAARWEQVVCLIGALALAWFAR